MIRGTRETRAFSKEHSSEERVRLARDLIELRRAYRLRVERAKDNLAQLVSERESSAEKLAANYLEIRDIEERLNKRQRTAISVAVNFLSIRGLREILGRAKNLDEALAIGRADLEEEIEEIEKEVADRKELSQIEARLVEFYAKQGEKARLYQEELKARDVGELLREYDVFLMHGTSPDFVPGTNSLLNENVGLRQKLLISLGMGPVLSASTFRRGDQSRNLWADVGIILNGGFIENAFPGDAASVARSLSRRTSYKFEYGQKGIRDSIEEAICGRIFNGWQRYNEFQVRVPRAVGLYVLLDERGEALTKEENIKELLAFAEEFRIPIYAIQQGKVFAAEHGQGEFILGQEMQPDDIRNDQFDLPEEQREKMRKEIFEDNPFRFPSIEALHVDSRAAGRRIYIELNPPREPDSLPGKYASFGNEDGLRGPVEIGCQEGILSPGEKVKVLADFPGFERRTVYFVLGGKVRCWDKGLRAKQTCGSDFSPGVRYRPTEHIDLGRRGGTLSVGRIIRNKEDYLSGMREALSRSEIKEKFGRELGFHLYGFGEQAREWGDEGVAIEAFLLASEMMSLKQYQEVLQKRVDADGRFKLQEGDEVLI